MAHPDQASHGTAIFHVPDMCRQVCTALSLGAQLAAVETELEAAHQRQAQTTLKLEKAQTTIESVRALALEGGANRALCIILGRKSNRP